MARTVLKNILFLSCRVAWPVPSVLDRRLSCTSEASLGRLMKVIHSIGWIRRTL